MRERFEEKEKLYWEEVQKEMRGKRSRNERIRDAGRRLLAKLGN